MAASYADDSLQLAATASEITAPIKVPAESDARVPRVHSPAAEAAARPSAVHRVLAQLHSARRPSWSVSLALLVAVAALLWWLLPQRVAYIDPRSVVGANLAAAAEAESDERFVEPLERSAFHYYSVVLALEPTNAIARSGLDRIADHYLEAAKSAILDGRLAQAVIALDFARRVRPEHRRLTLVHAQLRQELDRLAHREAAQTPPTATDAERSGGSSDARRAPAPALAAATSSSRARPAATPTRRSGPADDIERAVDASALPPPAPTVSPAPNVSAGAGTVSGASNSDAPIKLAAFSIDRGLGVSSPAEATRDRAVDERGRDPAADAPRAAAPVLAHYVAPEYPSAALVRGIEGWIDVELSITPAGEVIEPRISDGKGRQLFDRPTLLAVRQWKYEPRPDRMESERVTVRVSYKLDD